MKLRSLPAALAAIFLSATLHAQSADYASLKTEAEKLFAEKSFAKAHELYAQALNMSTISSNEARWVWFRFHDTQWRSEATTQRADTTKLDAARDALDKLVRDIQRAEDKDRVWVEVQESLGDFWWTRRDQMNWGAAWPFYQQALDWWAGQSVSDEARQRYLDVVWRTAKPPRAEPYYRYGNYGNILPREILLNTLKIAVTENDKAHANYLLAVSFQHHGGDWDARARVPEHFEAAIKPGKGTDWYDDALYNYADWMMNQGRVVALKDGNWRNEPDFVKALELFRRFTREFTKGESRYFEQAQAQIKNITEEQVGVSVSHFFLPDSEVQYHLNWRNVGRIDLALYAVDLTADVNLGRQDDNRRPSWLQTIDLAGREKIKEWSHDTQDKKDYRPGNASLRYDGKLAPGAYVLEARGGGKSAREIVLVTDSALVLKTSGKQALIYFCNALNSSPQREGKVKLWERWHQGNRWQSRETEKEVNADGIAVFDLAHGKNQSAEIFTAARSGDRQAFSTGNSYR